MALRARKRSGAFEKRAPGQISQWAARVRWLGFSTQLTLSDAIERASFAKLLNEAGWQEIIIVNAFEALKTDTFSKSNILGIGLRLNAGEYH